MVSIGTKFLKDLRMLMLADILGIILSICHMSHECLVQHSCFLCHMSVGTTWHSYFLSHEWLVQHDTAVSYVTWVIDTTWAVSYATWVIDTTWAVSYVTWVIGTWHSCFLCHMSDWYNMTQLFPMSHEWLIQHDTAVSCHMSDWYNMTQLFLTPQPRCSICYTYPHWTEDWAVNTGTLMDNKSPHLNLVFHMFNSHKHILVNLQSITINGY